jgi:hypothetical protein
LKVTNRKDKPYLLSVGLYIRFLGITGHRYMDTKKKRRMRTVKAPGVTVLWTTYIKVKDEEENQAVPAPQEKSMKL